MSDSGSPSGGWREVYAEMGVTTRIEGDSTACPDCGDEAVRTTGRRFWCPDHGTFEVAG